MMGLGEHCVVPHRLAWRNLLVLAALAVACKSDLLVLAALSAPSSSEPAVRDREHSEEPGRSARAAATASAPKPTAGEQTPSFDELRGVYEARRSQIPQHDFACFPRSRLICTDGRCASAPGKRFALVASQPSPTMSRCNDSGCETYAAAASVSGDVLNIKPEQSEDSLLKIDLAKMSYVEVTTLGEQAQVDQGECSLTGGDKSAHVDRFRLTAAAAR